MELSVAVFEEIGFCTKEAVAFSRSLQRMGQVGSDCFLWAGKASLHHTRLSGTAGPSAWPLASTLQNWPPTSTPLPSLLISFLRKVSAFSWPAEVISTLLISKFRFQLLMRIASGHMSVGSVWKTHASHLPSRGLKFTGAQLTCWHTVTAAAF